MDAVNCVLLTKVVIRFTPFQRTTDDKLKLLPLTVRVKAGPPAVALFGESEVSEGTGLLIVIVTVAGPLSTIPSFTLKVKLSEPVKPTAGV